MNMTTKMKTIIKIMKIKDKETNITITTTIMCYVLRVSMKGWMVKIIIMQIIKT